MTELVDGVSVWRTIRDGTTDDVKKLVLTMPVDTFNTLVSPESDATFPGAPALLYLVKCGRTTIARSLISNGVSLTGRILSGPFTGYNVLHLASLQPCCDSIVNAVMSSSSSSSDVLQELVRQKGSVDGFTPLHCAARYGRTTSLKAMLPRVANTVGIESPTNGYGSTVLMMACSHSETCADVEMILMAGGSVDTKDSKGHTAAYYATMERVTECNKHIDLDVLLLLILHGLAPGVLSQYLIPSAAPSVKCIAEHRKAILSAELTRASRLLALSPRQVAAELSVSLPIAEDVHQMIQLMNSSWLVRSTTSTSSSAQGMIQAIQSSLSPSRVTPSATYHSPLRFNRLQSAGEGESLFSRMSQYFRMNGFQMITVSRITLSVLLTFAIWIGMLVERYRIL
eukprot:PhF_6_TR16928/c0_g1_i3/m.25462